MINDNETNTVYFSVKLKEPKFTEFCNNLTTILNEHRITHHFLGNTNDIWCRDYMPVQLREDKFIEYRYNPDYLKTKTYAPTRTDPAVVCQSIGLSPLKTDIVLDGGNVIRYGNKVIMTDKLFQENANYTKEQVLAKLKDLFEITNLIIIPWDRKYEKKYGHADGLVRFIDENTVLVNNWYGTKKPGKSEQVFRDVLTLYGLSIKTLEFDVLKPDEDKNWGYLNYLQMKDLLLIPVFGIDEDNQAKEQFHQLFPEYSSKGQIETIDAKVILEEEGVLNCISWNVLS